MGVCGHGNLSILILLAGAALLIRTLMALTDR